MRTLMTAILVCSLASAGLAQQPQRSTGGSAEGAARLPPGVDAAALTAVQDDTAALGPFTVSVDQLVGLDIYGPEDQRIGRVDSVQMTQDGQLSAVAAEVGGFLGSGDRKAVIGLLELRQSGERLVTQLSRAQLQALPVWLVREERRP